MICVFDACSLLAYLRREPGKDVTRDLLTDDANTCFVYALNLMEVFYNQRRDGGEDFAEAELDILTSLGLKVRDDLDTAFWKDAGRIKGDHARVSLADCCGLALARRLGGTFVSTDHRELDPLVAAFPITFVRTDAEFRAWIAAGRPPL